ncbi:MAG: hypothetical protein LBT02_00860 [Rickettsiales bacterium]|jgi:hypothetical protein|nr:hypothetical protein [Rickettsiales bacterium]
MAVKFTIDDVLDFVNEKMIEIVAGVLFIIFVLTACLTYFNVVKNRNEVFITEYYKANKLFDTEKDKAKNMFSAIYTNKKANNNIKTISGIRLAELVETEDAIKILLEIYKMGNNDLFLRNLAGVSALNILINKTERYDEIVKLIVELKQGNNPLVEMVQEQEGLFEIQRGNIEQGREILKQILKQEDIDNGQRNRINNVLSIY